MPDYVVTIGGQRYQVTAPNDGIMAAAGRRFDEWLAANPPAPAVAAAARLAWQCAQHRWPTM